MEIYKKINGDWTMQSALAKQDNVMVIPPSTYVDVATNAVKINYDYEEIFEEMKRRFNVKPIIHHNCHNCGGRLELKEDQHIFICPYCGSVYAVGINQINS